MSSSKLLLYALLVFLFYHSLAFDDSDFNFDDIVGTYLNCGGNNFTGAATEFDKISLWQSDDIYLTNETLLQSTEFEVNASHLNTDSLYSFNPLVLNSVRVFSSQAEENKYRIPLRHYSTMNGPVTCFVRLVFAELLYTNSSARMFDVSVQGFKILKNFRVINTSKPSSYEMFFSVNQSFVEISFLRGFLGDPMISGISVLYNISPLNYEVQADELIGTYNRYHFGNNMYLIDSYGRSWFNYRNSNAAINKFSLQSLAFKGNVTDIPPTLLQYCTSLVNPKKEKFSFNFGNIQKSKIVYIRLSFFSPAGNLSLNILINKRPSNYSSTKFTEKPNFLYLYHFRVYNYSGGDMIFEITPENNSQSVCIITAESFRLFTSPTKEGEGDGELFLPSPSPPSPSTHSNSKSMLLKGIGLGIVICFLFFFLLFSLLLLIQHCCFQNRTYKQTKSRTQTSKLLSSFHSSSSFLNILSSKGKNSEPDQMPLEQTMRGSCGTFVFPLTLLQSSTGGFSNLNVIGQGGFGQVFRGKLEGSGLEIAVKRLGQSSQQGEHEFRVEVELLSRLHHRNLVNLIGYCDENEQLMLVYEFVPNGTLRDHLLDEERASKMTWQIRMRIALSAARGLEYLHKGATPPVIHRDIKSSNILLEMDYESKVADFGLSKLGKYEKDLNRFQTHITTRVKGTMGYLDPSYYERKQLTEKSDVYSFGVVMLELLTGRLPVWSSLEEGGSLVNLVEWTEPYLRMNDLMPILAPSLDPSHVSSMNVFASLALKCVNTKGKLRPDMSQLVRELEIAERNLHEEINESEKEAKKEKDKGIVEVSGEIACSSEEISPKTTGEGDISVDMGNSWVPLASGKEVLNSRTKEVGSVRTTSFAGTQVSETSDKMMSDVSEFSPRENFVANSFIIRV